MICEVCRIGTFSNPLGMLGPYPVTACTHCNACTISPVPDYPPPLEGILAALERAGCEPYEQIEIER